MVLRNRVYVPPRGVCRSDYVIVYLICPGGLCQWVYSIIHLICPGGPGVAVLHQVDRHMAHRQRLGGGVAG